MEMRHIKCILKCDDVQNGNVIRSVNRKLPNCRLSGTVFWDFGRNSVASNFLNIMRLCRADKAERPF